MSASPKNAVQTIPKHDLAEAPLSFGQERLLLLEKLTPGLATYNVPRLLRIAGRLDPDVLRRAFDVVVDRHEPLRTSIGVDGGGAPVQRIRPDARFELTVLDLRGRDDPETTAAAVVDELAWKPFDLERDLMIRATLAQVRESEDWLAVVCHHLVSDYASSGILLTELAEVYAALIQGREPALTELPISYADYAVWQRDRLGKPSMQDSVAYWREQLAGAPERIDLPADRPRPPVKSYRGAYRRRRLDARLGGAVRDLARAHGVSTYVALLAALEALIHRYTGAVDVVVGTAATGRHHEETMPLIGFFTNTLVLRTDVSGEPTFAELLGRVKTTAFGAYAHQEVPFEKLVEELNPQRDLSLSPLFQVLFTHELAAHAPRLGGHEVTVENVDARWARFDLALGAREHADGAIDLTAEYSSDLFDPESVDRLLGHFETLLGGAVEEPDRPIGVLPLLTPGERRLLLHEWNGTSRPTPTARLHELVTQRAAERPHAVAVQGADNRLTYAELDGRSNQLARRLAELGAGPETLVAVCLDRVPEVLVAFLGVLKTGAAYVPVDPTYPAPRLEAILDDSDAPVLVTQEDLLERLPARHTTVLCLDRDAHTIDAESDEQVHASGDSESLAYVIYTSGSTGRPKGVQIRHGSVLNLLESMRERPGLGPDDVVVNVTTSAFDLSVPDLYLPLVCGAQLVVMPRNVAHDGRRLADALDEVDATFMQATPTTWAMLDAAGWKGREGFKIVCGGETLPRALANDLLDRGDALWHMYGPTETTVWSSIHRLERGDGPPPIGGPIANTAFYVVDERLQPVPIGVPGELMIGGKGLARGYRNLPELTTEKFVADPFSSDPGARVYRTGDSMRWRPDGTLEFLGRLDQQVKLHGFRIELGEIEALLDRHADVRASVASLYRDPEAGDLLAAYAVPEPAAPVTGDQLRRYLASSLPGYMVPSVVMLLDDLPVTANGKLDRSALPAPGAAREELARPYVAPRTPVEEQLAEIWTELLPIDRVGIDDDFFDLGGHSMLALRLVARIQALLGVDVFLTAVFERPTVRELAALVSERVLEDADGDELAAMLDELEVAGA